MGLLCSLLLRLYLIVLFFDIGYFFFLVVLLFFISLSIIRFITAMYICVVLTCNFCSVVIFTPLWVSYRECVWYWSSIYCQKIEQAFQGFKERILESFFIAVSSVFHGEMIRTKKTLLKQILALYISFSNWYILSSRNLRMRLQ